MARFSDRPKRLQRQRESRVFGYFLMPLAWLAGAAGLVGLLLSLFAYFWHGVWHHEAINASFGVLFIPVLLLVIRFVRGHYSRQLEEP